MDYSNDETLEKIKELLPFDEFKSNADLLGKMQIIVNENHRLENMEDNIVQDNMHLRELYKKTAETLRENGKVALGDYFLAQIDAVPTIGTMDLYDQYINRTEIDKAFNEILSLSNPNKTFGYMDLVRLKNKIIGG